MKPSRFVPKDWKLTDRLKQYARDKGLSDSQIETEVESFRVCERKRPIRDWDRAWMRWVHEGIKKGWIVPVTTKRAYRRPQAVSDEQRQADILAFESDPLIRQAKK